MGSNLSRGLTLDFQVVRRIADDSTRPSEASWEWNKLKTAGGLGSALSPQKMCVFLCS